MKTTIKIGMLAAAFLLAFASCSNAVKPITVDDAAVKSVVADGTTDGQGFTVTNIAGKAYGKISSSDNDHYEIQITFSYKPKEDSLKKIVFKSLKDASSATEMPQTKQVYMPEVKVVDNIAYFTFSLKPAEVKELYIFIPSKDGVTAENGAKLNHDKDSVPGEEHDDAYAILFDLTSHSSITASGAGTVGNVSFAQAVGLNDPNELNKFWFFSGSIAVKGGSGSDSKKLVTATVGVNSANFAADEISAKQSIIEGFVKKCAKVEYYDWKNAEWKDVSASFKATAAVLVWEADVSIPDGCYARIKYVEQTDTDKMALTSKLYGYPLKYKTLKEEDRPHKISVSAATAAASTVSLNAETTFWGDPSTGTGGTWGKDPNTNGKLILTFTPPSSIPNILFADNAWQTVNTVNKDNFPLFKGFNVKSVTDKDNNEWRFKCYNSDGSLIAIKSIDVVKSDVYTYPEALNQIVILFENSKEKATSVFVSPNVKTEAFTGSYNTQNYEIPSMTFANNKPPAAADTTDVVKQLRGWKKL